MAIKVSGTEVISDDKRILNNEDLPDIRPSLLLDFANSKTLDPRITFTRGSTATYYDGKTTAKAEENLVKQSQGFDNAVWYKDGTTITANDTAAPDGTTTADRITDSGVGTSHYAAHTLTISTSATYSISCYIKYGGGNGWVLVGFTGSNASVWFDIQNGTVGTSGVGVSGSSITDVGGGWYRCELQATYNLSPAYPQVRLVPSDGTSTYTADGSYVWAWGFQVEQRSSATAYTATTDSPIVKYQPVLQTAASGEARFDHDPVTGESKGLLIEGARTNLLTYSLLDTNWAAGDLSRTINVVAPDNTTTGVHIQEDTDNAQHLLATSVGSVTPGDNYAFSVHAKADGSGRNLFLTANGEDYAAFDLNNGTVLQDGGHVCSMEEIGNGWYRCTAVITKSNTNTSFYVGLWNATNFYTGDGYSGVFVWGAQVEEASFPTSYIPTSGSTVTRAVDDAKITGSNFTSWFSAGAFSIYREINMGWDMLRSPSTTAVLKIDNLLSNSLTMRVVTDASAPQLDVTLSTFGSSYADTADNNNISGYNSFKQALAIDPTSLFSHATGGSGGTDTSVLLANDYSRMLLNADEDRNWIKKIAFYPKKLTLTQLSAMVEE